MGDVVHALPAVSDMLAAHPGLAIDWLVEKAFADIPRMHPGIRRVLPMAWRRWRKRLHDAQVRRELSALRSQLREVPYDLVLDLQGLMKSALWARQARGSVAGYDRASIREPLAALLYRHRASVPRDLQAVERNRRLAAAHLHYEMPTSAADFGLRAPQGTWRVDTPSAVLVPCASRVEKLWPEDRWIAIGRDWHARGLTPVVVWGTPDEEARAHRIAQACHGAVPPFLSVGDMAAVLASARQVVGLDTGFTHLAAALGRPTLGIYCDHEPGLAGITGSGPVVSVGGKGQVPSLDKVKGEVERLSRRMGSASDPTDPWAR